MKRIITIFIILFWVNSNAQIIYKLRLPSDSPRTYAADGVGIAVLNDTIYMMGGWNIFTNPVTGSDSLQFMSADGGYHWSELPHMPFIRHDFIYGTKDSKIMMCSGDGFNDAWYYTTFTGWVNISLDMGPLFGSRFKPNWCYCADDGYWYVAGGIQADGTLMTDLIRSNDFVTWEKVADLPTQLIGCNKGGMAYLNGKFYIMGGWYEPGDVLGGDVWEIVRGTWTFTKIITNDDRFKYYYCNATQTPSTIWFTAGRNQTNQNSKGVWYSIDGRTFTRFSYELSQGRHATGMCNWGEKVLFACGNLWNQFWLIERIDD